MKLENKKLWDRLNTFWSSNKYEQSKLIADLMVYLEDEDE